MKQFFGKSHSVVKGKILARFNVPSRFKIVTLILIMASSFYGGMYFISTGYSADNQKEVIMSAITSAFNDTELEPIIMIIPKYSMAEKAKRLVRMDVPERKIIKISTTASTRALFGEEINPGLVSAAFKATGNGIKSAWGSTKNGASWTYNKAKFWD